MKFYKINYWSLFLNKHPIGSLNYQTCGGVANFQVISKEKQM
jgi:hypothetical protein